MRYLLISLVTLFAVQIDLPEEVPFDSFEGWSTSRTFHDSRFWIISDLSSIERFNTPGHNHIEGDARLTEVHFISPEGSQEIYVVSEVYNGEHRAIFFGLFTVQGDFLALYTREGRKEVWEKMPQEIYDGPTRGFAEYMHQKLGRYIISH